MMMVIEIKIKIVIITITVKLSYRREKSMCIIIMPNMGERKYIYTEEVNKQK
jgi:hypothetical protein